MRLSSAGRRLNNVRRRSARIAFSQEGEDLIIERLTAAWEPSTYIDIGAHHPFRFSNTALLYQRGWTGVNVDISDDFLRLFRKYRPRDVNVRAAIAGEPGTMTYFVFQDSAFNTLDAATADEHIRLRGAKLVGQRDVEVATLQQLLDEFAPQMTRPGLLTVDVEGLDLTVIASLDMDKCRPRIICAEETGVAPDENTPLAALLFDKGYKLRAQTANTRIFVD